MTDSDTQTEDQRILRMIDRDLVEADAQIRRWQALYAELAAAKEAITRLLAERPAAGLLPALEAEHVRTAADLEGAEEKLQQAQERVRVLRGVLDYLKELR